MNAIGAGGLVIAHGTGYLRPRAGRYGKNGPQCNIGRNLEDASIQSYRKVYFSVVKHPENIFLDGTIADYNNLVGNHEKFSAFTSVDVINASATLDDPDLNSWITWYKDLYKLK